MSGWVFGPDVGLPDAGWMSQEEFQQKVDPPTAILPTQPTGERRAVASWRVARSLDVLLAQLNALAPRRSKASDGSIGDTNHLAEGWRNSDHNPWVVLNGQPLVTARDYTHDPVNGLDCQKLADALVTARDPRVKYIIHNRRIIDSRAGSNPWKWMPYSGINPHTKHMHLSVMDNASCDSSAPWALPGFDGAPTGGGAVMPPNTVQQVDEMHEQLLGVVKAWGGGVTDDKNTPYNALMLALRNNVEIHQCALMLQKLSQQRQVQLHDATVERIVEGVHERTADTVADITHRAVVDEMATSGFWASAFERAGRTFAQTALVLFGAGPLDVLSIPWESTLSLAAGSALVSLLMSLASSQTGTKGSPSLLKGGE